MFYIYFDILITKTFDKIHLAQRMQCSVKILSYNKFDKCGLYTDERIADKINDHGYLLRSGRINKV